jgi:hypothetical protein
MRHKRSAGAAAIAIFATLTCQTPLFADAIAQPSASPAAEPFRGTIEQFKVAKEEYIEAQRIRSQQIKIINLNFKLAIDKSTLDFRNAMALAKNPDQKTQIASQRKSAVSAAIIARDAAIEALGAEPIPPVEPVKAKKAPAKNKGR